MKPTFELAVAQWQVWQSLAEAHEHTLRAIRAKLVGAVRDDRIEREFAKDLETMLEAALEAEAGDD
jgi:hypothetical protein